MKKLLPAIIISSLFSGYALADAEETGSDTNTGQVLFSGTVTSVTCHIDVEVDGLRNDTVDLKSMKPTEKQGIAVNFSLVPRTEECLKQTKAQVGWQSAGLTNSGLKNMNGTAKGVSILLTAINSTTPNQDVTIKQQTIDFGDGTNAIRNMNFKAQMVATEGETVTKGSVLATATYSISYI
ncbi:fimbrial protein [Pragia fontium]|uniref:fimbrial protein n=1 Tax=Pragia fontium TaxID=82985 RepID=UPI0006492B9C|nr:fimbrial protein [Pragia fontium]AKJ43586.1 fimbrial protein [Pragia fontium]